MKIYSVEGNIGSGKSTLLKKLKEEYSWNDSIVFLQEPVDDWNDITEELLIEKRDVCYNSIVEFKKQYPNAFTDVNSIHELLLLT